MVVKKLSTDNKGFTLVEVIVAFAVLAIISGSLLHTFVLSTKTNKKASDIDKANVLAVKAAEVFKAYPDSAVLENKFQSAEISSMTNAADYVDIDKSVANTVTFTKYYDQVWNELPVTASAGAVYRLQSVLTFSSAISAVNTNYYPVMAGELIVPFPSVTLPYTGTVDYRLTIDNDGSNYKCRVDLLSPSNITDYADCTLNSLRLTGRIIPFKLFIDSDNSAIEKKITVVNNATLSGSQLEAGIYVFDNAAPSKVVFSPDTGISSYVFVNSANATDSLYKNTFATTVLRLENGIWKAMISNTTEKTFSK